MSKVKCTIITPVYNRSHTIKRLYESLQSQTNKEFQWLIIDDGSREDINPMIKNFILNAAFPINYYKKKNGGKHTALNYAMDKVNGEICYIVDSDDRIPMNGVERVLHWYKGVKDDPKVAGVGGLRRNIDNGEIIGTSFEGESLLCKSSERPSNGISGDKAEVFKTDVLRLFPFPEFPGEKFLSESVVWNEISAAGYDILWFNEVIYEGEYLADGLTQNLMSNYANSPQGFALYLLSLIKYENISLLRRYYYYGMYYHIVKTNSTKEVAEIFHINSSSVTIGASLYKLKKLVRP